MEKFIEQKFNIPELKGISKKNIEEHLKLYAGYIKNANLIREKVRAYHEQDAEGNAYIIGELTRRFSFEYNGIRNHEVYFSSLEGGVKPISKDGELYKQIEKTFGAFDSWLNIFKNLAATVRGIGWVVLWYNPKEKDLIMTWIDEQHLGQLNGCTMILALDMWEHAFVYDYPTSEKKKYVEAFFENLNWEVIEQNFLAAQ